MVVALTDVSLVGSVFPGAEGSRPAHFRGAGDQHFDAGAGCHGETDRANPAGEGSRDSQTPQLFLCRLQLAGRPSATRPLRAHARRRAGAAGPLRTDPTSSVRPGHCQVGSGF